MKQAQSLENDIAQANLAAMRFLLIAILFPSLAHAAEATYPHWDGSESIEQYTKRANLPPTKTLDLGGGVKLELVLIPAGKFTMGTEEPKPVDEAGYRSKILTGQAVLAVGGGALLVLLVVVLVRAIRNWQRPQYSLAWFLVMSVAAGIGLLGGLHWYFSERAVAEARSEYEAALARYLSSEGNEKPAHEVTLTQAFYMGKYEVTQEQYMAVLGRLLELTQEEYLEYVRLNSSHFKGRDLPMDWVRYDEAAHFCELVSEKTGSVVRLPTEAEWERACRAGTKTAYYTGDAATDLDRAGWYDRNSKDTPHPVGQKTPNAWGVYDMHGNVWEWCADWYENYGAEAVTDPQGPPQGADRVLHGGYWGVDPPYCRSARRYKYSPNSRANVGFRVVVVAAPRTP